MKDQQQYLERTESDVTRDIEWLINHDHDEAVLRILDFMLYAIARRLEEHRHENGQTIQRH